MPQLTGFTGWHIHAFIGGRSTLNFQPQYLCRMKMKNEDLKKITEIKQYLLDPPVSFKLGDYAITYLQNAIDVLAAYPDATSTIENFRQTLQQLELKGIAAENLRNTLQGLGKQLSVLTNR